MAATAAAATTFLLSLQFLLLLLPTHQLATQNSKMISTDDLAALYSIKSSLTDLPRSSFFSSWDFASPDPCSTFSGVTCSFNRVTILSLGSTNSPVPSLSGTLPPSLSNLTQLSQLILSPGLVTGPIPPQLGSLTNLRVISLPNNRLTGPIPSAAFSSLPNLHTLDLSFNQLTGSIPPILFTGSTQLKVLVLSSNRLSGTLPPAVLTDVLHLDLKNNLLTGELPARLPSKLRYLSASNNMMWGPLNGLQSLSELVYLDLSMNKFSGPIPPSLLFNARAATLSSLFLQRNNLSGGLPFPFSRGGTTPPAVSSYGEGSIVDLSHNSLSGGLSPVLADVESLFLNNNRLRGVVPREYVDSLYRGRTKTLYLQHNYLSGFPLDFGAALPDTVSLCLSYNCMVPPPVGLRECPSSAGEQLSRPQSQCGATIH